ncbi:MAG: O-methyltransferase [Verrucomicrobiota bacterium]
MNPETWTAVDEYFVDLIHQPDSGLEAALTTSAAAELPEIQVSEPLGKFLNLLARIRGARRILELGTLGGYSTIWLAKALPRDGKLITLESEVRHAEVARGNLDRAGLGSLAEIGVGAALDSLRQLLADEVEPFDLVFVDADKDNYPNYLPLILDLSRPGTVLVADNVVRKGAVLDPNDPDAYVQGVRRFNELLANEPRVDATVLQTVGAKGYDGFVIGIVR